MTDSPTPAPTPAPAPAAAGAAKFSVANLTTTRRWDTSPTVIRAALAAKGGDSFTLAEAEQIVKAFLSQPATVVERQK